MGPPPAKYDFEKMIEEALKNSGEAVPAVKPMGDGDNQDSPKKSKYVKKDPKKQALLEKRKKYDPRAAIKNSKKSNNGLDTEG